MHTPYHIRLGHRPDFKVRYRFYTKEEGGRSTPPYQGYRSDFWYSHPEHGKNELFMIYPEFENSAGEVILQNDCSVPAFGTARMWITVPPRRSYHYDKIKPGLICYFMEGGIKVAECEVLEIIGLLVNPTGR